MNAQKIFPRELILQKHPQLHTIINGSDPWEFYENIKEIGSGTYGHVYKAKHKATGTYAALKCVKIDPTDDLKAILTELFVLKDCHHANIVEFFGAFITENRLLNQTNLWIAMEYCGGKSLQDIYTTTRRPFEEPTIAFVMRETVRGLVHMHAKQQIHRDIKGANILLTRDGSVKLADFGISAQITATLGKRMSFIGTPYWMAPEVADVRRKGGYDERCDIWAVGITAIELAELEPPMFSLHPMKALQLMTTSRYRPPKLRDKAMWGGAFHDFLKTSLRLNPKSRPAARDLLEHQFLANPALGKHLTVTLLRQFHDECRRYQGRGLLDELLAAAPDEDDEEGADGTSAAAAAAPAPASNPPLLPSRIPSRKPVSERTPPLPQPPRSGAQEDDDEVYGQLWAACSGREPARQQPPPPPRHQQQPGDIDLLQDIENCLRDRGLTTPSSEMPPAAAAASATPVKPKRPASAEIADSVGMDDQQQLADNSAGDGQTAGGAARVAPADSGPPPTPPQRTSSHAGRNPPPARPPPPRLNGGSPAAGAMAEKRPRPMSIAGPSASAAADKEAPAASAPRPATKMGAGMSQIFEDNPLKINAVAKWTNQAGCDLVFIGANEGLYYMSLDQLHESTMVLLVRQRCLWLFVYRGILVSLSGRHPQLYRHDLAQLFPTDAKSKIKGRVAMRLANNPPSAKIPRTKGCMRVSAAKHPETAERWLACALPESVLLLQWDNARRTFLEFKSLPCPDLPQPLLTFEMLIRSGFKLPFVCVGVLRGRSDACVRFRMIDLNRLDGGIELWPNDDAALDEEVEVTSLAQLELSSVLVCYRNLARVFHMDTGLVRPRSGSRLGTLSFEFTIESVQCLDDAVLCFYKHGFQAKSFLGGEVVQDATDRAHVYRFVGFAGQNPVMERRPADDPMASCDLVMIIGHVSA